MYSFTVLEVRSLTSRGQQDSLLVAVGSVALCLFRFLVAVGTPWLPRLVELQFLPRWSHGLFPFGVSPLLRTFITGLGAHLGNPGWSHPKILNLLTSAKTRFPNKVTFTCSRDLNVALSFEEGVSQWLSGKKSTCQAGDMGSIPGSWRPPGEGNGNPLPCFCLENSMDRRALRATVHRGHTELDTTE